MKRFVDAPSRLTVRSVACVECGAEPGQPCIGRRGPRASNHATRIESYEARKAHRDAIEKAAKA